MHRISGEPCVDAHHVSVTVTRGGRSLSRVLDIRSEYAPLTKELVCRVVAAHPRLAGEPWAVSATIEGADTPAPHVVLGARLADGHPGGGEDGQGAGRRGPLVTMKVPFSNFSAIAAGLAAEFQLDGCSEYYVAVHDPESAVVAEWNAKESDDDFELMPAAEPRLVLPGGFSSAPLPGPRRVVDAAESWVRCVFRRRAYEEFLDAAARETQRERSWLGTGRVHLEPEACHVIIEDLAELPGEAGQTWVKTLGRDWAHAHAKAGDRMVAFLHLHPRTLKDPQTGTEQKMGVHPSGNDEVVAWNVGAASPRPAVFPIAMFGAGAASSNEEGGSPNGDVAAHAFENGLLTRIQLEVES